ncbi:MFS general substrate transporter [Mycena vitilis]|nr:MFS general substrate transporter [Mycena vitilis]
MVDDSWSVRYRSFLFDPAPLAPRWLIMFATFGYSVYLFGVYEEFYASEYLTNHTPSSIAWIGSFQLMAPFALGIVSGKLFDDGSFPCTGNSILVPSAFMLSLAKPLQYYQVNFLRGIELQSVGMGMGLGFTFVPSVSIAVHHFAKRRGLASGVALSGGAFGSTVSLAVSLIPRIGFGPAVRAAAYIVLAFIIAGNLLMRTRLPPRSKRPDTAPPDIKSFFKDTPYIWTCAGLSVASVGLTFPLVYIQLYSTQHRVGSDLAFYSASYPVAIMNGSSAFGRIAGNHLADLYGPINVETWCTFITGGLVWAVLGIDDAASLVVVSILYGVFSGACTLCGVFNSPAITRCFPPGLALAFGCLASLAKTPNEVGARMGLALAFCSMGFLTSSPIQGTLLTSNFFWIRPAAFSGVRWKTSPLFFRARA